MTSIEYTITTDAFSIGGHSFAAETIDFTVPYRTSGTFSITGEFDGTTLVSVSVHPDLVFPFGKIWLNVVGDATPPFNGWISLESPPLKLPNMDGQTTMGINDTFAMNTIYGVVNSSGIIHATQIGALPEPSSLALMGIALALLLAQRVLRGQRLSFFLRGS